MFSLMHQMDLIDKFDGLALNLDAYLEAPDLSRFLQFIPTKTGEDDWKYDEGIITETMFQKRFKKLNAAIAEVVDEFRLTSFHPLAIEDAESVSTVISLIDQCNGYVFDHITPSEDVRNLCLSLPAESRGGVYETSWKHFHNIEER